MGRRRRGRRSGFKIPIISAAILGGQVAAAVAEGGGQFLPSLIFFQQFYTGINPLDRSFDGKRLLVGYGPWIVKRFAGAVARPRMPIHGLPISLS